MLSDLFEKAKKQNRAALVPFVACGDHGIKFTESLVSEISEAGADIIELGLQFSDPMADGKVIQQASKRALANATNVFEVFEMVGRLRASGNKCKFVLFSYMNPLFHIGLERAARLSAQAGIDAWLVVDVPLEESAQIREPLCKNGLDLVPLASVTTPPERIRRISQSGGGFLYYVTVAGVTGARDTLPDSFVERLKLVKSLSVLPVAAGFGISTPQMASMAAASADAVVVGSALVSLVHSEYESAGEAAAIRAAGKFVSEFSKRMHR